MSHVSANMIKPIYSALPEEERRAFAEWLAQQEQQSVSLPAKPKKQELLDDIADQIGDFFRPGMEEQAISEIMFS
ncbi:hypothetical protein [Zunongwangia atlantica]|uniref:Uncharacterized protein n=1 Tax=Zunongwangia atlantica 22II14-10F7 TaxID=1185767 RepID=A0A1Y1SZX8_9FLAO|nr:hypothetical protein [Zunongwangia atlantica]ORL43803.1 hypothetical protein IIF7_19164 [Zunongwangia atlantica 22II14-10F7]